MNCHCEHSDCHPNGDCRSAAVVVIETYGMRQQVCDTCRRINPASKVVRVIEPEWTDAEVQTPTAGRRYFACVNTVTGKIAHIAESAEALQDWAARYFVIPERRAIDHVNQEVTCYDA